MGNGNAKRLACVAAAAGLVLGGVSLYSTYKHMANKRRIIDEYKEQLGMSLEGLVQLEQDLRAKMDLGLRDEPASSVKMLPSFVLNLPSGEEAGEFYAIDLGGTNFRVLYCTLGDETGRVEEANRKDVEIPRSVKQGTARELFDFLATSLRDFIVDTHGRIDGSVRVKLGFCFSFPLRKKAPNVGCLLAWTKGFEIEGGLGEDAAQLLQESCNRIKLPVEVSVIVNDTIGVLAAGRYEDDDTDVGVILGTGTNAACVVPVHAIPKWNVPGVEGETLTAVNTEWGDYSSSLLPRCKEDFEFDRASSNPGKYHFEKLLCGYGLGEVTRRILVSLAKQGVLFEGQNLNVLQQEGSFPTASMAAIGDDKSQDLEMTAQVLAEKLSIQPSNRDKSVAKEICDMVTCRAAKMLAAGLVAVTQIVREKNKTPSGRPTVVTIDGGVYENFTALREQTDTATKQLLDAVYVQNAPEVLLTECHGGSSLGAALLAAATQ